MEYNHFSNIIVIVQLRNIIKLVTIRFVGVTILSYNQHLLNNYHRNKVK